MLRPEDARVQASLPGHLSTRPKEQKLPKLKRIAAGCVLVPFVLIASCAGKMAVDARMYNLPGEVLTSKAVPTQSLGSAMQVAEALDSYVQPRFEILRDRNFGAFRVVFRLHAGIVQLKVDTPEEQKAIANVNAANRDYAISLLHCAPKPKPAYYTGKPRLEMLYFNRESVASPWEHPSYGTGKRAAEAHQLNFERFEEKAIRALPLLMQGKEVRAGDESWEVLMRPVLASKQECLSCHATARTGDTLGVMVYSVGKQKLGGAIVGMR